MYIDNKISGVERRERERVAGSPTYEWRTRPDPKK
jgi:hypothetical protein